MATHNYRYLYWTSLKRLPGDIVLGFEDMEFARVGVFNHPGHIPHILAHNGVKRYLNKHFGWNESMPEPLYQDSDYEEFMIKVNQNGLGVYTQKTQYGTMTVVINDTTVMPNPSMTLPIL
jgi:hypothetical protein